MSEVIKVLEVKGAAKGGSENGVQFYQLMMIDQLEQKYIVTFGVKMAYTEATEKLFKRMLPVAIPQPEITQEVKEEPTDGTAENRG